MPQLLIMAGKFVAEKAMEKIGKKLIEKTMDMAKDFTENVSKTKDNVDSGKIIDAFKDSATKAFENVLSFVKSKLGMSPEQSNDGKDNDEEQEKTKAKEKNKTLSPEEERNKNGIQETIDNVQNPINLFADFFKTLKEGLEIAANKIKEKFKDLKEEQGQDKNNSNTLNLNNS